MRRGLLLILLASWAGAQNLAEPQYQLTGSDYKSEAPAIQQMFYNVSGAVQAQNAENTRLLSAISTSGGQSGSTVAVTSPLSGNGSAGSPVALTGAVAISNGGTGATTAAAALANLGVTGLSSACASGFYFDAQVAANGLVTGGTCVSVPTNLLGYIVDNFIGQVNGTTKNFTLSNVPSLNSEQVVLDGVLLSGTSDYTRAGTTVSLTTAPAANSTSFFVRYSTGASGVNAFILNSSQTVSGQNTFTGSLIANNVIHNSAVVKNFSGTTTNTSFSTCFATVSVTTNGSDPLRVWYSGPINNTTGTRFAYVGFLLDGGFDAGLGSLTPLAWSLAAAAPGSAAFSWITSVQSPGTHSACLTLMADANTAEVCTSVTPPATGAGSTTAACQFGIEEVK